MIDRRALVTALAGSVVGPPFVVGAQPHDKVWRVGFIGFAPPGTSPEADKVTDVFLQTMAENGFVEGRNLRFERRAIGGRYDLIPAMVSELIALHVDVLLTTATPATRAADRRDATKGCLCVRAHWACELARRSA